jgi:hypothetical protein
MSFLITLSLLTAAPSFDTPSPAPAKVQTLEPDVHRAWGLSVLGGGVGVVGWIGSLAVYLESTRCDAEPQGTATHVALQALGYDPCRPQASTVTVLPLIGPWLALSDPVISRAGLTGATVVVGVAQLAALTLCILGPLIHLDRPDGRFALALAPGAGSAPAGLSLAGRF